MKMFFRCAAAEFPEDEGPDSEVEEGAGEKAEKDDDGDGVEDFATGLAGSEEERDKCEAGGESSHENRDDPFLCATKDHFLIQGFALFSNEVKVVGDHHDSISRGDAGKSDKSDH